MLTSIRPQNSHTTPLLRPNFRRLYFFRKKRVYVYSRIVSSPAVLETNSRTTGSWIHKNEAIKSNGRCVRMRSNTCHLAMPCAKRPRFNVVSSYTCPALRTRNSFSIYIGHLARHRARVATKKSSPATRLRLVGKTGVCVCVCVCMCIVFHVAIETKTSKPNNSASTDQPAT